MQILFLFFAYSFGGWILEGVFNKATTGNFTKDNFLKLPIKPMYGISMILLVAVANFFPNWIAIVFGSLVIPTCVEFITGTLLEIHTGRKWWDYSSSRFNINGHVCLVFSFSWMVLSILTIYLIQPLLVNIYFSLENFFNLSSAFLVWVLILDSILSFFRHSVRIQKKV